MILRDRDNHDHHPTSSPGTYWARGMRDGVLLLLDALERGDIVEAGKVVDFALRVERREEPNP